MKEKLIPRFHEKLAPLLTSRLFQRITSRNILHRTVPFFDSTMSLRQKKYNKRIARVQRWEAHLFKYNPLDEHDGDIRILTLHPGTNDDQIEISIHHEHFTALETPEYEALSYVWGSERNPKVIKVRQEGLKTLKITRNLDTALRHLRDARNPRKMWIDAICLDQKNLKERGFQVQRMGQIYKRAKRVVVWLGPEADDSTHAMELMKSLASKVEIDWDNFVIKPSSDATDEPHWADKHICLPYSKRDWRALCCLLNRTWFKRLWVRQEINLSRPEAVVFCGEAAMLWLDFRKANSMMMNTVDPTSDVLSDQGEIIQKRTRHIDDLAFYRPSNRTWQTLRNAGSSQCSNPRDKIYANLGLIREAEGDLGLVPNYEQSVREVNIELVLALLKFHKRLDILRCCELSDEHGDLPSWTPNWSIGTMIFGNATGDASAPASAQYLGKGVLRVEGIFGGVLATMEIYQESIYYNGDCSEIYKMAPENVLDEVAHGGGILLDSFCRTLAGGDFRDSHPDREDYPTWQSSRQTVSEILRTSGGYKQTHDKDFLGHVSYYGWGRCFFTTEDGKTGWAPKAARTGDIVCVILGCAAPVVLRKTEGARYQVVGECYMDGIMDGELLLGVLPENLRKEAYLNREDGFWYDRWIDSVTKEVRYRDPRLTKYVREGEKNDLVWIGTSFHRPFLTSERLKEVDVEIRSFDLV